MYKLIEIELEDRSHLDAYAAADLAIHKGDPCIADNGEWLEFGHVSTLGKTLPQLPEGHLPQVVRRATLQDQAKATENAMAGRLACKSCSDKVKAQKLDMGNMRVRYSFDRKKLTISFTSEGRVDFRDLVKTLADELGTRVEMRQVGPRDAAAAVGGFGPCGRRQCCCAWLRAFTPVSIRMAKDQGVSLNPNTLNGMCGRLKCCLRYEHACYVEIEKTLPAPGLMVETPAGVGQVVDRIVLARRLRVRLADRRVLDFPVEDLKPLPDAPRPARENEEAAGPRQPHTSRTAKGHDR